MQIAMQVLYSYLFSVMLVILGVGVINQIVHFNATKQRSIAAKKTISFIYCQVDPNAEF